MCLYGLYVWEENKCLDECNATNVSSIQMNSSKCNIIPCLIYSNDDRCCPIYDWNLLYHGISLAYCYKCILTPLNVGL